MDKLLQLRQEAETAHQAFLYGKDGQLVALDLKVREARKKRDDYEKWLFKGSGVFGNEI